MLDLMLAGQSYLGVLQMLLPVCGVLAAFWIYLDASEHTTSGCAWAICALFFWPIVLPIYFFLRFYYGRRSPQRLSVEDQLAAHETAELKSRLGSDIERAKYLEHVSKDLGGTMYEPDPALRPRRGYPHFADQRADALIQQRRFEEAFAYVSDLLAVARKDGDLRAVDTYLHYIGQIPQGSEQLAKHDATEHGTTEESTSARAQLERNQQEPQVPF